MQQRLAETVTAPTLGQIATAVWLAGVAVMAVWFAVVNLRHVRLLHKNREKLECESPIPVYLSEKVSSPCLVGFFKPMIYLTPASAVNEESRRHVLTHELTHYHHGDHIWALVRCVCLCVYWFNPLVWVAAWVSRRDCELACDEGALKRLGETERIAYGKTLLAVVSHTANPSNLLQTATAMTETMKQLKERVNFIVKKPKISLIAVISMVLICAIVAGCAAAGSTSAQQDPEKDPTVTTTPTSTPETSPSTNPTTKPTDPKPTEPKPTDPTPTEPIQPQPDTPAEELAKFNALFGDYDSWYNKALTSEYTTPEQINLEYLFYNGFAEESRDATDAELSELKAVIENRDFADMIQYLEIIRLPVDKMNQVLQDYFGITLEDVDDTGFDGMYYLESTNCYYLMHTDAVWTEDFNAISVEYMEDGSILVYYTADWESTVRCVTLMPHGDGYRILSNVRVE